MLDLRIRPIALGIIWHGDRLLVAHGLDSVKNEAFFRPLGGGIEALRRELREELDAELLAPRLLGVIANIFEYEGRAQHELAFVLEARFADARLYERAELEIREANVCVLASWKSLRELIGG